jgi:hypothetical protein
MTSAAYKRSSVASGGGTGQNRMHTNLQQQQQQHVSSTGSTASEGVAGDMRSDFPASSATVADSGARIGSEQSAKTVRLSVNHTGHGGSPRHNLASGSSPRTGSGNGGFFAGSNISTHLP